MCTFVKFFHSCCGRPAYMSEKIIQKTICCTKPCNLVLFSQLDEPVPDHLPINAQNRYHQMRIMWFQRCPNHKVVSMKVISKCKDCAEEEAEAKEDFTLNDMYRGDPTVGSEEARHVVEQSIDSTVKAMDAPSLRTFTWFVPVTELENPELFRPIEWEPGTRPEGDEDEDVVSPSSGKRAEEGEVVENPARLTDANAATGAELEPEPE